MTRAENVSLNLILIAALAFGIVKITLTVAPYVAAAILLFS